MKATVRIGVGTGVKLRLEVIKSGVRVGRVTRTHTHTHTLSHTHTLTHSRTHARTHTHTPFGVEPSRK